MKIYVAYVVGGDGYYEDITADSPEAACAMAEVRFDDYFGNPIIWGEPLTASPTYYRSGKFNSEARVVQRIIVAERPIVTMEDVKREKEANG